MVEDPPRRPRISSPAEHRTPSAATRSLHNFSFPPTLSWGNQRVLRCVNPTTIKPDSDPNPTESDSKASESRPWNLRTRRANPNPNPNPNPNQNPNFKSSLSSSSSPPTPKTLSVEKGKRIFGDEGGVCNYNNYEGERCKFSIALKKEEIKEDFMRIKGVKPPRRPKKRAKYIQKQLDSVFPGCWLSEITPDLYKIEAEVAINVEREEDEGGRVGETFMDYRPPKLSLGDPHPDPVVETASLSAVQPPDPTYNLKIENDLEKTTALSCLQIDTIVYACQMGIY